MVLFYGAGGGTSGNEWIKRKILVGRTKFKCVT